MVDYTELFDESGTPTFLPEDFDPRDVRILEFHEITAIDTSSDAFMVKPYCRIFLEFDNGMQIEKAFVGDEYPAALESWEWIKNRG